MTTAIENLQAELVGREPPAWVMTATAGRGYFGIGIPVRRSRW